MSRRGRFPMAVGSANESSSSDPDKMKRDRFVAEMRRKIEDFWRSGDKELVLPVMQKDERRIVHFIARDRDLRSFSQGKEGDRFLTISRVKGHLYSSVPVAEAHSLALSCSQVGCIKSFLTQYPVDKDQVLKHYEAPMSKVRRGTNNGIIHGDMIVPRAPSSNVSPAILDFRRTLPAYLQRRQIMDAIARHQVILITGGTGCGKTTQVPQFILEEAHDFNIPIRIICTQPRRLPAIAVAERVAKERGEGVGGTVGYHIRLEQRCNQRETVLTYCTSGVLLRMLTVDSLANNVSHIILDEIHEREQNTDYLLIALKEALRTRHDLKVILMSATMEGNKQTFLKYFHRQRIGMVDIPSRLHSVEKFFLGDILAMTNHLSTYQETPNNFFPTIDQWGERSCHSNISSFNTAPNLNDSYGFGHQIHPSASTPSFSAAPDPIETVANHIANANPYGRQHSTTSLSHNQWQNQQHFAFGSSWNHAAPSSQFYVDSDYGYGGGFSRMSFDTNSCGAVCHEVDRVIGHRPTAFDSKFGERVRMMQLPRKELVGIYNAYTGRDISDGIDPVITTNLITFLLDSDLPGSILVFLPGYDDILNIRDRLLEASGACAKRPQIYMLHSQMNSFDQQKVFEAVHDVNIRKVILSTNIAEASLTIDDVIFVVDCGKVKEKMYDHASRISQLKVVWIAKSNAEQRSGRAGRCRNGFCFRLYSQEDYDQMFQTQVAEMKRAAIHDVCLHAKMFAPENMSVKSFLGMAPEPPDPVAIDNSFSFLQQLGALFSFSGSSPFDPDVEPPSYSRTCHREREPDLTELGCIIAHLPLDPQLARMLLFGVALKCFNPIVTLVAALSHRDPFILPLGDERANALTARDELGRRDFSDHLMLIRAFYLYTDHHRNRDICRKYFLSVPTMKMIDGIRRQLVHELRRLNLIPSFVLNFDDAEVNTFSHSWGMVQAAIVAGCYPGLGTSKGGRARKIRTSTTSNEEVAGLHPSCTIKRQMAMTGRREVLKYSAESKPDPSIDYLAFQELSQIDEGITLRTVTATTPLHTLLFAGPVRMEKVVIQDFEICSEEFPADEDMEFLKTSHPSYGTYQREYTVEIDKNLAFRGNYEHVQLAMKLKFKFMNYFMTWLRHPNLEMKPEHHGLLECMQQVLDGELDRLAFNAVTDLPKPRPSNHHYHQNGYGARKPPNTFERFAPPMANGRNGSTKRGGQRFRTFYRSRGTPASARN